MEVSDGDEWQPRDRSSGGDQRAGAFSDEVTRGSSFEEAVAENDTAGGGSGRAEALSPAGRVQTAEGRRLSSRFRGVCWNKKNRRWQAAINSNGRYVYLGSYQAEEAAARVFDNAAIKLRRDKAKLNFPFEDYLDANGEVIESTSVNAIIEKHERLHACSLVAGAAPGAAAAGGSGEAAAVAEGEQGQHQEQQRQPPGGASAHAPDRAQQRRPPPPPPQQQQQHKEEPQEEQLEQHDRGSYQQRRPQRRQEPQRPQHYQEEERPILAHPRRPRSMPRPATTPSGGLPSSPRPRPPLRFPSRQQQQQLQVERDVQHPTLQLPPHALHPEQLYQQEQHQPPPYHQQHQRQLQHLQQQQKQQQEQEAAALGMNSLANARMLLAVAATNEELAMRRQRHAAVQQQQYQQQQQQQQQPHQQLHQQIGPPFRDAYGPIPPDWARLVAAEPIDSQAAHMFPANTRTAPSAFHAPTSPAGHQRSESASRSQRPQSAGYHPMGRHRDPAAVAATGRPPEPTHPAAGGRYPEPRPPTANRAAQAELLQSLPPAAAAVLQPSDSLGSVPVKTIMQHLQPGQNIETITPGSFGSYGVLYSSRSLSKLGAGVWDGTYWHDLGEYSSERDARTCYKAAMAMVAHFLSRQPTPPPAPAPQPRLDQRQPLLSTHSSGNFGSGLMPSWSSVLMGQGPSQLLGSAQQPSLQLSSIASLPMPSLQLSSLPSLQLLQQQAQQMHAMQAMEHMSRSAQQAQHALHAQHLHKAQMEEQHEQQRRKQRQQQQGGGAGGGGGVEEPMPQPFLSAHPGLTQEMRADILKGLSGHSGPSVLQSDSTTYCDLSGMPSELRMNRHSLQLSRPSTGPQGGVRLREVATVTSSMHLPTTPNPSLAVDMRAPEMAGAQQPPSLLELQLLLQLRQQQQQQQAAPLGRADVLDAATAGGGYSSDGPSPRDAATAMRADDPSIIQKQHDHRGGGPRPRSSGGESAGQRPQQRARFLDESDPEAEQQGEEVAEADPERQQRQVLEAVARPVLNLSLDSPPPAAVYQDRPSDRMQPGDSYGRTLNEGGRKRQLTQFNTQPPLPLSKRHAIQLAASTYGIDLSKPVDVGGHPGRQQQVQQQQQQGEGATADVEPAHGHGQQPRAVSGPGSRRQQPQHPQQHEHKHDQQQAAQQQGPDRNVPQYQDWQQPYQQPDEAADEPVDAGATTDEPSQEYGDRPALGPSRRMTSEPPPPPPPQQQQQQQQRQQRTDEQLPLPTNPRPRADQPGEGRNLAQLQETLNRVLERTNLVPPRPRQPPQ